MENVENSDFAFIFNAFGMSKIPKTSRKTAREHVGGLWKTQNSLSKRPKTRFTSVFNITFQHTTPVDNFFRIDFFEFSQKFSTCMLKTFINIQILFIFNALSALDVDSLLPFSNGIQHMPDAKPLYVENRIENSQFLCG
ncbi:MAG: hypothetical protein IJY27_00945 [Clostridia bacterium]|nr:hypothetical protein [Clostridia bacterium]